MYKDDFPYFSNTKTIYLDNAATTQKPKSVIDSLVGYYEKYCANTHRSSFEDANKATREFESARETLKNFINASKNEEIIFTKGVTQSINFIASSFAKRFKTIIISSLEHHANIVPWHQQGRSVGDGLEVVGICEDLEFDMKSYEKILKNNPNSFVSITHISNAFGKIHDIKKITQLAHKYNCVVLVDGAQSLLHANIDVKDLDVDFFALSAHKTLAPTGVGAVYIKEKFLDEVKPYETGGGAIRSVSYDKTTFLPSPYRFEAGTQNIAGVIGFKEALRYINGLSISKIEAKNSMLYKYLYDKLSKIEDVIFYTNLSNVSGSLSFNVKNISHEDIGILLAKMDVAVRVGHHCAMPVMEKLGINGTIRASVAFYNEKEDIDAFIRALNRALEILRG